MQEVPKPKIVEDREAERSNWSRDQKERGYYYDDAHGYEVYNPDTDDSEDNESPPLEDGRPEART